MKRVIIASNNAHKIKEIYDAFSDKGWECVGLQEAGIVSSPEETGDTFAQNALIKARAARELTNCAVLADDSGLSVDRLGGQPGVYSSRYAGIDGDDERNNQKLLKELEGLPFEERTAHFSCVLAFIGEDGKEILAEGKVEGLIGFEPKGTEGFGYDPLFYPNEFDHNLSFAEVPLKKKQEISHRARALLDLRNKIFSD